MSCSVNVVVLVELKTENKLRVITLKRCRKGGSKSASYRGDLGSNRGGRTLEIAHNEHYPVWKMRW